MDILQESPLNAQPTKPDELTKSFLTPANGMFARNHGDIPVIDGETYRLRIVLSPAVCAELKQEAGLNVEPFDAELLLEDLKKVRSQAQITAALEVPYRSLQRHVGVNHHPTRTDDSVQVIDVRR